MFTGNNIQFKGDMQRRVLKCRLDPQMQDPSTRNFENNPKDYINRNRYKLVNAALSIIKAYFESERFQANLSKGDGKLASFENWDMLVRQPILWLAEALDDIRFEDPVNSIKQSMQSDPDTQLWGLFLQESVNIPELLAGWKTAKDFLSVIYKADNHLLIIEYLQELLNTEEISHISFGKALSFRKDKVVNNLRIVQKANSNRNTYKLERITS